MNILVKPAEREPLCTETGERKAVVSTVEERRRGREESYMKITKAEINKLYYVDFGGDTFVDYYSIISWIFL